MPIDPYLVVRAGSLYVAVLLTAAAWMWRRPGRRAFSGAVLAWFWNLPAVLALHLAADRLGWWNMKADGGVLLGMPVDVYLSWAWLWGAVPALAFPSLPIVLVAAIALAFDLALMPAAAPVLRLGPAWLIGEGIGLALCLIPSQLLARWTVRDARLAGRAALQVVTFSGLLLFVLPAVAIDVSGGAWLNPVDRPVWQISLWVQLLMVPAIVGLSAVQEFVTRGGGTPVPFDPPQRLVVTGPYAYVRNPMQLSAVVLLALLGLFLRNPWVAAAGIMAHLYSTGIAGWDEDEDLRRRFGDNWLAYAGNVRPWVPRLRPWRRPVDSPARLFVASGCGMCSEVGGWFARHHARGLAIVPAESHESRALTRITFEPAGGGPEATGVEAVARALEHVHLGWAFAGWALRLPGVRWFAQLLTDASGGEPRRIEISHVPHPSAIGRLDPAVSSRIEGPRPVVRTGGDRQQGSGGL